MHNTIHLNSPVAFNNAASSYDVQISDNQCSESKSQDSSKVRKVLGARADILAKNHLAKLQKQPSELKEGVEPVIRNKENVPQLPIAQTDDDQKSSSKIKADPVTSKPFAINECPYILTSEIGQMSALEAIRSLPPLQEGLYLGFAFEFNYHLLAERTVKYAWICDINERMHTIYNFFEKTIVKTHTRNEFLELFRKEIQENEEYYFGFIGGCGDKVIDYYLNQEFSWLHSEEKFLKIRDMYVNGLIQHVNLNLVEDSSFFASLKKWTSERKYVFDIVYVSNIPEWLQRKDSLSVTRMKANLLKIISPQTIFVDAKQTFYESGDPEIRITQNIHGAETFPSFIASMKGRVTTQKPTQRSGMSFLLGL